MLEDKQAPEAVAFQDTQKKLGLVIVGGGTGGKTLLHLFHEEPTIDVIGIADIRPDATAIKYAQSLNIPTSTDFIKLIKQKGVDVIVDVTANAKVREQILEAKRPATEVLGGLSAKLMWNFTEILERRVVDRTEEIKNLQEELLKNKVAMLQELSAGVSQKLRNPLAMIVNTTNYLVNKHGEDSRLVKHLNMINEQVQIAEKTVKDLIELVKPGETMFSSVNFERSDDSELQRQLVQSEKLAGIGIIAAGIAHEVNNPLAVIQGKAEMILDQEEIPNNVRKFSEDILKYTKRASDIVGRVTFYSRAAWAPGGEAFQIDVKEQLMDALKICKLSQHFDNVDVLTDFQDVPPISGNVGEIQQVFMNLMKNAAQAMKGKGRLCVKSWFEDGSVAISIKDTGPGIKKENLQKLFTPFFTTKDPGKGTGLGLNIVHKIVTTHAGSIHVESEEGKGATFIVRFPKAKQSTESQEETTAKI